MFIIQCISRNVYFGGPDSVPFWLFGGTLAGHSCGTFMCDTVVGHTCRTLLWSILVGHL